MNQEVYLQHPNFGLLFRVCWVSENQELFTTLYAQRLFFLVRTEATEFKFQPMGRTDARIRIEGRLRALRRSGQTQDYKRLQVIHQQTFA